MTKIFLKWWLIICLIVIGIGVAIYFNMHNTLWVADVTKISFLIIAVFIGTSIWIGKQTYYENDDTGVGSFVAESCLALGMVGTVTGFLYMLGTAFSGIDMHDVVSLQSALMTMAAGMSTALYTTLIGLISSLLIKIQLVNLEIR